LLHKIKKIYVTVREYEKERKYVSREHIFCVNLCPETPNLASAGIGRKHFALRAFVNPVCGHDV
jgi:hypothetical protein